MWKLNPKDLRRRFLSLATVIAAAVFLSLILWAVYRGLRPFLPESARSLLADLGSSDWKEAVRRLREAFDSLGAAGIPAFIGLQCAQVFFAPIPGQITGFLGGMLFGFWNGLALTMIGLTVGSFLAMGASRLLGRPFVVRMAGNRVFERFEYLIDGGGLFGYFLLFLLPALPDDAICFVAGLSRLPVARLVAVCLIGRLPGMAVLTLVGASVDAGGLAARAVFGVAMVLSVLIWLYQDSIERWYRTRTGGGRIRS
jgi:uncharacterized membrane protein YdjX (TVP38/TMEM64 family)